MKDTGGNAFPNQYSVTAGNYDHVKGRIVPNGTMEVYIQHGISIRDYFAAHASDEDIACAMYDLSESGGLNGCTSAFARRIVARYAVADSMLAERAKP